MIRPGVRALSIATVRFRAGPPELVGTVLGEPRLDLETLPGQTSSEWWLSVVAGTAIDSAAGDRQVVTNPV